MVDDGKASLDGKDLRMFYHAYAITLPVEVDRIVKNLYTTSTTVQFGTQKMIPSNSLDDKSYALVFGGKSTQRVKADRRKVFAFYEVGLYLKQGKGWGDIELELDLMETGLSTLYPGPFFRVEKPSLRYTTAWWFEYMTDQKKCTMRPYVNNTRRPFGCTNVTFQNLLLKTSGFISSINCRETK